MLRHTCGPFSDAAVDRTKEPDKTVPKSQLPHKVSWRRDGDVAAVVAAVKKYPRVTVSAAVGAGKSTKIPIALADALGMLVVHTIPAHHSARLLSMYLQKQLGAERIMFMSDIEADMPQHGVVLMTNAYFFSRMCTDKFGNCPNFLLYMDENHESDSFTAVIREVGPSFSCVKHMVFATATAEPGVELAAHLPGKRKMNTYQRTLTRQWSANDTGRPWSASNITQNTVIFIERTDTVKRLMSEYRAHGLDVHALGAQVSDQEFDAGMAALRDVHGPVVVLLLDYTCRSSLTLPRVSTIIDSGEVRLATVKDNAPSYFYRDAYDTETQQALARGGRCDGDNVVLWKPADRARAKMCDLESMEGDAANLMYRMLGFKPPLLCGIFEEITGPVPIDLVGAIQGSTPLKLYPPESREPWIKPGATVGVAIRETNAYKFQPTKGVGPRPVSCRTVRDSAYPRSPSPKFNALCAVEEVDSDSFKDFVDSQNQSPVLSPVYTLSSRSVDNLSVLTDDENPSFAKPKRVAKRFQVNQGDEKPLPVIPTVDVETLSGSIGNQVNTSAVQLADKVLEVRGQANKVFEEIARSATQVKKSVREAAFSGGTGSSTDLRELISGTDRKNRLYGIPDDSVGTYYYYHGMDAAPKHSSFFIRGFDTIVQFCQSSNAHDYARVLPERDKLYAIKTLLDKYNNSTARVFGIQRVISEIRARPKEDFQDLLKPEAFHDALTWAVSEYNTAKADVLLSKDLIIGFLQRPLDKMGTLLNLEQSVMREVVEKFEFAAIVKDPDKMISYFETMNNQRVEDMGSQIARRF